MTSHPRPFVSFRMSALMDPLSLIESHPQLPPPSEPSKEEGFEYSPTLDEKVWKKISPELLERILAALPIPSLVRLRTVSKEWNKMLKSSKFMEHRLLYFKSQTPCYLVTTFVFKSRLGITYYNPVLKIWHQNVMPESSWQVNHHAGSSPCLVASDKGLLLLGVGAYLLVPAYTSYVVCNPITGTYIHVLPLPSTEDHVCIGIVTEPSTKAFMIVMSENIRDIWDRTAIYNSTTGSWKYVPYPFFPPLTSRYLHQGVLCNGFLYTVDTQMSRIVGLDLESGVWSVSQSIPEYIIRAHLIESHGKLIIVGGLDNVSTRGRVPSPQAIGIWKLDQSRGWDGVKRLPKELCKELQVMFNLADFRCTGQHDILYLSSTTGQDTVAYNILKRTWQWLPDGPRAWSTGRWRQLPFEPSLDGQT